MPRLVSPPAGHLDDRTTASVCRLLAAAYADPRLAVLLSPGFVDAIPARFARTRARPGFGLVLALDGREIVGAAFGHTVPAGSPWWPARREQTPGARLLGPRPPAAAVLSQLVVSRAARRHGLGRELHDTFLASRSERLAGLRVLVGNDPARALYSSRGWQHVAPVETDAGRFDCLARQHEPTLVG